MNKIFEKLIVLEGLDGAGTTTQLSYIQEALAKINIESVKTNEPTDNPIGRLVRQVLQKKVNTTPLALAMLYAADREDHLYNDEYGIEKIMKEGKYVISDRYFYSSFAYQGVVCDKERIIEMNNFPHARIIIYIDTSVDECISRIEKRGNEKELFEKAEFLENVKNNYDLIFSNLPEGVNLINIDGKLTREEIRDEIMKELKSLI